MAGQGGDGRQLSKDDNYDPLLEGTRVAGVETAALRRFIERIERLEAERRGLNDDIKDVKTEAKLAGFDPKIISFIIRERRKDPDDLEEFNILADAYRRALL